MLITLSVQKQYPYFLSPLIQQTPSLAYTLCLCKWGALILTILATLLIFRFRQNTPSIPLLVADYDFTDTDDEDDEICSLTSTSDDDDDDDDDEEEEEEYRRGEYFRVRGSTNEDGAFLRRCSIVDFLSLSEIANTKNVVKLWDTIGFGFDRTDGSVVSVYDGELPNPAVLVSAAQNAFGNIEVKVWDTRLRRRIPAVMAQWGPSLGKTVGVESCEAHKVYVKDDGRYGFTVGDIRNARSPLGNVTDSHLDLWWPNSFIMKI